MSTLLRQALQSAYQAPPTYAAESQTLDILEQSLKRLTLFQTRINNRPQLTRQLALEAEVVTGKMGFVKAFDQAQSVPRLRTIALEGILDSILNVIGSMIETIVNMVGKFTTWLTGGGSYGHSGGSRVANTEQVKEQQKTAEESVTAAQQAKSHSPDVAKATNDMRHSSSHQWDADTVSKNGKEAVDRAVAEAKNSLHLAALTHLHLEILKGGKHADAMVKLVKEFDKNAEAIDLQGASNKLATWLAKSIEGAKEIDAAAMQGIAEKENSDNDGEWRAAINEHVEKQNAYFTSVRGEIDAVMDELEASPGVKWLTDEWMTYNSEAMRVHHKSTTAHEVDGDPVEMLKHVVEHAHACNFVELGPQLKHMGGELKKMSDAMEEQRAFLTKSAEDVNRTPGVGRSAIGLVMQHAAKCTQRIIRIMSNLMRFFSMIDSYYVKVTHVEYDLVALILKLFENLQAAAKKFPEDLPQHKDLSEDIQKFKDLKRELGAAKSQNTAR